MLVLQGGGALGAYQAGVYQALHEAGIEPDWVIGTSIGAINASLIAGNKPDDRLADARANSGRVGAESDSGICWRDLPGLRHAACELVDHRRRHRRFLRAQPAGLPRTACFRSAPSAAGYYSTQPLEDAGRTRRFRPDQSRARRGSPSARPMSAPPRCAISTAATGAIGVRHVMASGALPPAFPAVRIDGELYWDGGILSNTPIEAVFDDNPRRNSLIFAVHMWNPHGSEPDTMAEVLNRHKDMQYSSRDSKRRSCASSKSIGCVTSSTNLQLGCPRTSATGRRRVNWPAMAA